MTVITLTTDFGTGDHEAGVLKGVIWKIAPAVQIADLSHDITPHNILEAALLLWRASPYFPDGTIHVVVVDPGVGTSRRGLAARLGSQYFVGPDNGLLSLLEARAGENNENTSFVHLDQPKYWLPEVSSVFHGRDVFAPVAAYLASGIPLNSLGTTINDPVRMEIPRPTRIPNGWRGQVIHIDHFGNLSTNINLNHLNSTKEVTITINDQQIAGLVSTFGERPAGTLVALLDSSGSLAISVVNGSAAQLLKAGMDDKIEVLIYG
jgi:S-adenosyl-L-methionine hydrolase (adenosine-forming)